MHTFLPYPNFERSLRCLDNQRLGKQRLEAMQILRCHEGLMRSWTNHPAVLMWREHPRWLKQYYNACLAEWERRGFRNIVLAPLVVSSRSCSRPPWL
ncbi:MAG TPA: pyrimidine dimer DNA glycosylase/endonuclease V, partial [Pirellulales bacterium]|nr:pyrimidine dimer DNA glycosylase/endonuclease V [Pirellulales bacterium]